MHISKSRGLPAPILNFGVVCFEKLASKFWLRRVLTHLDTLYNMSKRVQIVGQKVWN
jgi:hypothetical protein